MRAKTDEREAGGGQNLLASEALYMQEVCKTSIEVLLHFKQLKMSCLV
jgi:hypothetical protein